MSERRAGKIVVEVESVGLDELSEKIDALGEKLKIMNEEIDKAEKSLAKIGAVDFLKWNERRENERI